MRSSPFGFLVLLLLAIVVAIFLFTPGSRPGGRLADRFCALHSLKDRGVTGCTLGVQSYVECELSYRADRQQQSGRGDRV
jgi:hypothetical protein